MRERKSFLLRIDPNVHEALERWAKDDLRSLNAQVEFLLKEALRRRGEKLPKTDDSAFDSPGRAKDAAHQDRA